MSDIVEVILNNTNHKVILDEEDVARVQKKNWFIGDATSITIYCSWLGLPGCNRDTGWGSLSLGKFILREFSSRLDVDHIDRNPFNNSKSNLRLVTRSENCMNRGKQSGVYTSKYKGVIYRKDRKRWRAKVTANNRVIYGGMYDTEREAAIAVNKLYVQYHGEFAVLNIIDDELPKPVGTNLAS
jgi:hypothetical protein